MSEVIGKVIHIGQTEVVGSAGTFKKRLIVVATSEQYSQQIPVDFVQDKCDILDKYNVGDEVKISINIRGNEYQGKWYCSLNGWRIEKTAEANTQNSNQSNESPFPVSEHPKGQVPDQTDDLPF